jgi:hypothetical protein
MALAFVYDAVRVPVALERLALLVAGQDVDDAGGPHDDSFGGMSHQV